MACPCRRCTCGRSRANCSTRAPCAVTCARPRLARSAGAGGWGRWGRAHSCRLRQWDREAEMPLPAFYVVPAYMIGALLLGWAYFRRYQLTRPPLGVINLGDVTLMVAAAIVVPYLSLALPLWLAAGLFAMGTLSILYYLWEPILRARWAVWLTVLLLLAADVAMALRLGT